MSTLKVGDTVTVRRFDGNVTGQITSINEVEIEVCQTLKHGSQRYVYAPVGRVIKHG